MTHECETYVPARYVAARGRKRKCWWCPVCGKLIRLNYDTGCLEVFETERTRLLKEASPCSP